MIMTYAEVMDELNINVPGHLVRTDPIPTYTRFGAQGDVYFRREDHELPEQGGFPPVRINVVEGDAVRNAHILDCPHGIWYPGKFGHDILDFGLLYIPAWRVAYLTHTGEHGSAALLPGVWRLWGQASYEEELRRVAD